jgi:hypothetical protein
MLAWAIAMKRLITDLLVLASGILSVLYLLNIGVGLVEFIPDNIPFIGNLDEAGAMALLVNCLAYFGIDIGGILKRRNQSVSPPPVPRQPPRDVDI